MRNYSVSTIAVICLLFGFSFAIQAQERKSSAANKPETQDDVVKVDSILVWVPVSVRTQNGGYAQGLGTKDFTIMEDDVEQEIAHFESSDKPITVAFVMDVSDSTKVNLVDIQNAAISFLNQLKPDDKALIVVFDRQVLKLTEATIDRKVLITAIQRVRTGGGTNLYDAIETVIGSYLKQISGRKAIVVLTDGIDTSSASATFDSTIRLAAEQYASIYPSQFYPEDVLAKQFSADNSHMGATIPTTPSGESIRSAFERGSRYLRLLSHASGGRFYHADSLKNLQQSFAQVADELRQQYSLGYYPKVEGLKKEKRRIKVRVKVPGSIVRTQYRFVYIEESQ
ncbi:MAG: VWA domain-containing protein [Blastocatellia bacterium]